MQKLEDFMNWLTDQDWGWWPVLFLRPAKNQDFSNLVLLKMTCLGGPAVALALWLRLLMARSPVTLADLPSQLLLGSALFLFGYKFTFAHFWNRRARRLRAG